MMWLLAACASGTAADSLPPATAPAGFWDHWGDGKAELDGYRLTEPRYGELRVGEAVAIWVTEDFTAKQRVKSDGGHGDEFPVLKLNDVRSFQTGVYDYDVMGSTFVRVDGRQPLGQPTKATLSVAEWCGSLYEHVILDPGSLRRVRHSYFDGEADSDTQEPIPNGGVLAETLPFLARGLLGDAVPAGGERTVPFLPSMLHSRLDHTPATWTTATLRREATPEPITVPAGTFQTTRFVTTSGSLTTTFWVEVDGARRIVKWTDSAGEVAELTGSMRSAYWGQHGEADQGVRAQLGLGPTPNAWPK